jgi:hypothetical protein
MKLLLFLLEQELRELLIQLKLILYQKMIFNVEDIIFIKTNFKRTMHVQIMEPRYWNLNASEKQNNQILQINILTIQCTHLMLLS